jgi:hypothetical protein
MCIGSEPACALRETQSSLSRIGSHRLQENGLLFEFAFCLSQACLGEMIIFTQNVGTKTPSHPSHQALRKEY